ncbi:amino acid permease [Nonomuraea angiospora]|uniref:amino acid permease n=1 Tax=Nonomuraea angiospora TaxID=46172 RepID=UPI003401FAC3
MVAYGNATSSARLAARYPASGGTYVYGRERLGDFWRYLAGWGFVVGKTASCAAMALTVGSYLWPDHAHAVAVTTVVALTAVNYAGMHKTVWLTRAIVAVVVAVPAAVAVAALTVLGSTGPGRATAPLVEAVRAAGLPALPLSSVIAGAAALAAGAAAYGLRRAIATRSE